MRGNNPLRDAQTQPASIRAAVRGVTAEEMAEALDVALIVGGSIVIPHLRHARAILDELQEDTRRR